MIMDNSAILLRLLLLPFSSFCFLACSCVCKLGSFLRCTIVLLVRTGCTMCTRLACCACCVHVLLYFAVFLCGMMISEYECELCICDELWSCCACPDCFLLIFCCASNQAIWPCVMYADPRAGGEGVFVQSLWFLPVGFLLFVKERTMLEECRFV